MSMHFLFFLFSLPAVTYGFSGLNDGEAVKARVLQDSFPGRRCQILVTEVRDERGRFCGASCYTSFYTQESFFLKGEILVFENRQWKSTGEYTSAIAKYRFYIYSSIRDHIKRILPDSLLMDSLLLGYPHKALQNLFRACGLSFLLALSGMHLSILIQFCRPVISPLPKSLQNLFLIVFILIFVWISGFRHSLFRAMLMFLLRMFYSSEGEGKTNLNLLACSACIHIALFPDAWSTLSFQLSYAAMLGIFLFRPFIAMKLHIIKPEFLREILALSLGAQAMVAPWICWTLGEFHPFSLFTAILLAPLITLFLWISISALSLSFIPPVITLSGKALGFLEKIILQLGHFFSCFPCLSLGSNMYKRVIYAGILAIPAFFMFWQVHRRRFPLWKEI